MKGCLLKYFGVAVVAGCLILTLSARTFALTAEATIEANEISVGDSVQLSIRVSGTTSANNPDIGGIDGLEIRYFGPSTQIEVVNGKYSSSITHNYSVTALKAGRYQLGPFEVSAGRDKVSTNVINLTVADAPGGSSGNGNQAQPNQPSSENGSSGQSQLGNKLFMEMEVPRTKIYLGEKIPVKIRVYVGNISLENVSYPTLNQPEVALGNMGKPSQRNTVVNGIPYQLVEFSSILTFVKVGRFNLGPVTMDCNVLLRSRARDPFFGDFFNDNYERHQVQLKTKPLAMNVMPLPQEGRPTDFSGGIGRFHLDVKASPTDVLQGDPITVKMTVSGQGYLQAISPPHLEKTFGFKAYDPQKKNLSTTDQGVGEKVAFEQVLIPVDCSVKQVGPFVFSYFDPGTGSYQKTVVPAIPVNIKPNPNFKNNLSTGSTGSGSEQLGRDLIFIKDAPGRLRYKEGRIYTKVWFWLLQLLPLILLGLALYYRRYTRMLESDTPQSRALRAGGLASKQLVKANELLAGGNLEEFLEQLHRTVRQYLGEKYKLPSAGMMGDVVERLKTEDIEAPVLQDIQEFFSRYDFYHFTGAKLSADDANQLWEMVNRVIRSLNEKNTGKGKNAQKKAPAEGRGINENR